MMRRTGGSLLCLLVLTLAASCSSDDQKLRNDEPAAGGAGEATDRGGTGGAATGGSGGSATAGTSSGGKAGSGGSSGGSGGSSTDTGTGGDDDAPMAGASNGRGGEGNTPAGPVSACGEGNFDSGEPGCTACPPLPSGNDPAAISCQYFEWASRDNDGNLVLNLRTLPVHEAFGGQIDVQWSSEGIRGAANVGWDYTYDVGGFVFVFHLPVEARYADVITLGTWSFTDACGFPFGASTFNVYWDGVESWQCGSPAE